MLIEIHFPLFLILLRWRLEQAELCGEDFLRERLQYGRGGSAFIGKRLILLVAEDSIVLWETEDVSLRGIGLAFGWLIATEDRCCDWRRGFTNQALGEGVVTCGQLLKVLHEVPLSAIPDVSWCVFKIMTSISVLIWRLAQSDESILRYGALCLVSLVLLLIVPSIVKYHLLKPPWFKRRVL
jgi:hypothetical protein